MGRCRRQWPEAPSPSFPSESRPVSEDLRFCVYAHFVDGEEDPFYIGEGTLKRAKSRSSRNRHWNFKASKHGGFRVEILAHGITKAEAVAMEARKIAELRARGVVLTNVCEGPAYPRCWILGLPSEQHPRFGARFKAPWISESNSRRKGQALKPRPDLAERNRSQAIKHYARPVRCVETGVEFGSVNEAAASVNLHNSKICRALKLGTRSGGLHWEYVNSERTPPKSREPGKSTAWRRRKESSEALNIGK